MLEGPQKVLEELEKAQANSTDEKAQGNGKHSLNPIREKTEEKGPDSNERVKKAKIDSHVKSLQKPFNYSHQKIDGVCGKKEKEKGLYR